MIKDLFYSLNAVDRNPYCGLPFDPNREEWLKQGYIAFNEHGFYKLTLKGMWTLHMFKTTKLVPILS